MQVSLDLRHFQIYCLQSFPFQFHFVLKKRFSAESRCCRTIRWKLFSLPFFSSPFWKTSTIFAANQGILFVHCCVSHRKKRETLRVQTVSIQLCGPMRPQFDFLLAFYPVTVETQNPCCLCLFLITDNWLEQTVAFRTVNENALNASKRMHSKFGLAEVLDARRAIIVSLCAVHSHQHTSSFIQRVIKL